MKKSIYIIFSLFASLCLWSCSNDFLEENKKTLVGSVEKTIVIYNSGDSYRTIELELPSLQNREYTILQYPKWMQFDDFEGKFGSENIELRFRLNIEYDHVGNQLNGIIIIDVDNLGCIEINVSYQNIGNLDIGNPVIEISRQNIDFGKKLEEVDFEIRNVGDGDLQWNVVSYPEWITCPDYIHYDYWGGIIYGKGSVQTKAICTRANLEPGIYTGEIMIESNSQGANKEGNKPVVKISVSMEVIEMVNPENIWPIEGTVTDSEFDKKHNLLFVATMWPNELLVFNIQQIPPSGESVLKQISLESAPRCLSLSENGDYLFVGIGGKLLQYNVPTMELVTSIELDFIPFDVVYGENDWCYLSPDVNYNNNHVYCVNIKTGEIKTPAFGSAFGYLSTKAYFTKTPGVPKILATSTSHSPSGVYLFDISQPVPDEQSVVQFWHENYSAGRPFWVSGNGDLVYTGDGSVLRNPAKRVTGDDLMPIDRLPYNNIRWIDLSDVNNSLWGATRPDTDDSKIFRLNRSGYSQISSMQPSDHVTTIGNVKNFYPTSAHYVFSNSTGTILFIVKNVNNRPFWSHDYVNAWSIEYLEIK